LPLLKSAVANTLAQPQVFIGVGGWGRLDDGPKETYRIRVYLQGNKFAAEAFVNDKYNLFLLGDGQKVWRYDPNVKEYTFVKQPEDLATAFAVSASFARAELQRVLRLLAGSLNWLVSPKGEADASHARLYSLRPLNGGDWRGSDLRFTLDGDYGKLASFSMEDRLALQSGRVRRSQFDGTFIYDRPFNFEFAFTPPPGSKPAVDLPKRGDG
jgi:outer membrane lipoprotein-sorting protein